VKVARAGDLLVLASGPEAVRDVVAPVFEAIGRRTVWLRDAGAGSRLKLALNNWLACLVEGLAETLALTAALELDPQSFLDAVEDGPLAAAFVIAKGRVMLAGDASTEFALRDAVKDVVLARDAASMRPGASAHRRPSRALVSGRCRRPGRPRRLGRRASRRRSARQRLHSGRSQHARKPGQNARDLPRGSFADGQADPDDFPQGVRPGRFSDGEAPPIADEEAGRFSEGVEVLGDDDPEKHREGSFGDESPGPASS